MDILIGSCIIAQSGGPTSVINASAYGAIKTALNSPHITKVYGASNGIVGVLKDILFILDEEDPLELEKMLYTPSSILGSCRYKLADPSVDDTDYKKILEIFKKYNVRYFFYNGGNDSMDTCNKISKFMQNSGWDCRVIGIPKTIDNDLFGTHFSPGFPSASKFIATTFLELAQDTLVYNTEVINIVEVMGRNAGWLTASSSLASVVGVGPDLVYLPEVNFDFDKFIDDIKNVLKTKKHCLIAVSEGISDKDGKLISEYANSNQTKDSFGHTQLGGLASYLEGVVKQRLNISKVRGIELNLLQRCASHIASQTDIDSSFLAGETAVLTALEGKTDYMVSLAFDESAKNNIKTTLTPLSEVANTEKTIPLKWINKEENGLNPEFVHYALPLIQGETKLPWDQGLPSHAKLKKIIAQ